MSPYLSLGLLAGLTFLQVTLAPVVAVAGNKPVLPLLAVVAWGLLRGPLAGLAWAVALGAFLDLWSPTPFGYYTLALVAVAGVVALGHGRLFPGHLLLPALVTAAAALVFTAVQVLPFSMYGSALAWEASSLTALFAKSVALSLLWLPVVYVPLRLLASRVQGPRIDWET